MKVYTYPHGDVEYTIYYSDKDQISTILAARIKERMQNTNYDFRLEGDGGPAFHRAATLSVTVKGKPVFLITFSGREDLKNLTVKSR